jgi:hypothetical protein
MNWRKTGDMIQGQCMALRLPSRAYVSRTRCRETVTRRQALQMRRVVHVLWQVRHRCERVPFDELERSMVNEHIASSVIELRRRRFQK